MHESAPERRLHRLARAAGIDAGTLGNGSYRRGCWKITISLSEKNAALWP
ncbi:hypothetical protein [Pseudomonas capsici]